MLQQRVRAVQGQWGRESALRWAAYALLAFLTLYLLFPALTPVHPEGFTASVASLALHLRQDSLATFDLSQPLNVEFFGLTKLGWMLLVFGATALTGLGTSAAMTLIGWVAALVLAAGTAFLVRRWTSAPLWTAWVALILFPGVSESFFVFNDNVVASAFAIAALCALYLRNLSLAAVLCGALMGAAVLTRTDTVLVGAVVPLIAFERGRTVARTLAMLALAGVAGGIVLFGTLALFNATIFDVFEVASAAVAGWGRSVHPTNTLSTILYFLGLPGLILTVCGLALLKERDRFAAARLLVAPIVYLIILWTRLWEARQLLPLTPFFVSLAAIALHELLRKDGQTRRWAAVAVAGLVAACLLGPPALQRFSDGPRVLTGRIANIASWRTWQDDTQRDFALMRSLADVPPGRTRAIFVDHWNEDRYGHLALQEAGYRIVPSGPAPCARIAETFARGSSKAILLRIHQGYAPNWLAISGKRLEQWGLPCLEASRPDEIFFVFDARLGGLFEPGAAVVPESKASYVTLRAVRLNRPQLDRLVETYRAHARRAVSGGFQDISLEEAAYAARRRTSFGN